MGLLATWLIWRARKELSAPPAACCCDPLETEQAEAPAIPLGWWPRLLAAIDFLRTRRQWRYRTPWILMLGNSGAGKTSLLASLPQQVRAPIQGPQRALAIKGTDWHFFSKGVLIDLPGNWPAAAASAPDSKGAREWARVCTELDNLRPERALDGVVLTLCARQLQDASAADRTALAENMRQQLHSLGERFSLVLPVYLVVTACDSVPGFSAFWRSQAEFRHEEIFGWSAPEQFPTEPPAAWASSAFTQIGQQLKALQVDAAAHCERIAAEDADQFFLFPRHFAQLQEPLAQWLASVFQASAWTQGGFCRGIYFTGSIAASGEQPEAQALPRSDVRFVQDLLLKKVLAEARLAAPSSNGVWSRNRLIRRLQLGALGVFSALLVALVLASVQVSTQVDELIAAMKSMEQLKSPATGDCVARDTLYPLLSKIASLPGDANHLALPLSFLDQRLRRQGARRIADSAFKNLILPALACQLQQKANQLVDAGLNPVSSSAGYAQSESALLDYVRQLSVLEKNAALFQSLVGIAPYTKSRQTLRDFAELSAYAYATPLPAATRAPDSMLAEALIALDARQLKQNFSLPANLKPVAASAIASMATQLQSQLSAKLSLGGTALQNLQNDHSAIPANAREFALWLSWVRKSWLGSDAANNPIRQIQDQLAQALSPLIQQYHYPQAQLDAASAQFDAQKNYPLALKALRAINLPPYGKLFVEQSKELALNPKLTEELAGFNALNALDMMQVETLRSFSCQRAIAGWNSLYLDMANTYVQQYQGFLRDQGLSTSAGGDAPLFQRLALQQLQAVLNDSVQQAQISPAVSASASAANTSIAAVAPDELRQHQDSAQFAATLPAILKLQLVYTQNNFSASAVSFPQCVQNFANKSLSHIKDLAGRSALYQAPKNTSAKLDTAFFALGSEQDIQDYLSRQLTGVQSYASDAVPFLSYLQSSRSAAGANCAAGASTICTSSAAELYWSRSTDELNSYLQNKTASTQVSALQTLFLKILPVLSSASCAQTLDEYTSPAFGDGLFSLARQSLETQIKDSCKSTRSKQAIDAYEALAARFNQELAGRYPFSDIDSVSEAVPATVKAYFVDYQSKAAVLRQGVASLDQKSWAKQLAFLTQLDGVAQFFQGSLVPPTAGAEGGADSAALKLSVGFHALSTNSPGSEQVVNWSMSSGASTISYPNGGSSLDWPYGQPIVLDLLWAEQSKWRPSGNDGQADLQVDGASATYSSGGDWALLRLIERHKSKTPPADPGRLLLEFTLPVIAQSGIAAQAKTDTAQLYLSLGLSTKDAKTQNPLKLKFPASFPTLAPQ